MSRLGQLFDSRPPFHEKIWKISWENLESFVGRFGNIGFQIA